jgi:hypothetical protein
MIRNPGKCESFLQKHRINQIVSGELVKTSPVRWIVQRPMEKLEGLQDLWPEGCDGRTYVVEQGANGLGCAQESRCHDLRHLLSPLLLPLRENKKRWGKGARNVLCPLFLLLRKNP